MSRSNAFGTQAQLKRDLIAEICATLAFSAIRNNDKVGLLCFSDRVEKYVRPDKGVGHVLRVIREVLYHRAAGAGTSLTAALERLSRVSRRRAVVFIVSDFQDAGYERALRIARRRHDLIGIVVGDRREAELPDVGLMELLDLETGRRVVLDTSSAKVRRAYAERARRAREERRRQFRRMNLDAVEVRTGESFAEPLQRFFRARGKRR
jgi:uncharacterized protein (DUF58 family)